MKHNIKNILENFEPYSVVGTLSKKKGMSDMKYILPESGKSRSEKAGIVLSKVLNVASRVLELGNYFRQNDQDNLIKE